ncbi:hypothetical protein GR198_07180 [Rhizobium leguminosarum]|nr:hypothetical protein [Rhizobium leguminosarum]
MNKIFKSLSLAKLRVAFEMGATHVLEVERSTEILPDFDFVSYGGLTDKDYPVLEEFSFSDQFTFIHELELHDYGYGSDHPDQADWNHDLFKWTSGSVSRGDAGILNLRILSVDRFACRAVVHGTLQGSSMEMNMDVLFRFKIVGFVPGRHDLGYAAEAVAEALSFESEGKMKQAFFGYFAALDSFIESERLRINKGRDESTVIKTEQKLKQKLDIVVKEAIGTQIALNDVKIWGDVKNVFSKCEDLRNRIAHNEPSKAISKVDVDECFSLVAIVIAIVKHNKTEAKHIAAHYGVEL